MLNLAIISMGGIPPDGMNYRMSGAYHMDRWIYEYMDR